MNLLDPVEQAREPLDRCEVRNRDEKSRCRRAHALDGVEQFSGIRDVLEDLIRFSEEQGLSGLERLAGIPGTLGGAIYGNAGAFGMLRTGLP